MTKLGEAIALAAEIHKDQVDKAGTPYILHPLEVMRRATDYYVAKSDGYQLEAVQIVAVLHDALEDIDGKQPWDRTRLRDRIYHTFGSQVHSGVDCITKYPKRDGVVLETYDEYLNRVASNWISRIAKIADLSHNLDAFRIPSGEITEKDYERWDKYHRALIRLKRED